ncbi:hypothetical protein [Ramlibacter rhizophilus]|uniref:DUF4142 domain-containing protein n=1 Tax=Ramlibacter rhizophilus TaxID=1781167 RepID=A0A4Z0BP90_9BURK|nr:hypothetical protein [Ramlibacter rhizophilus]TFZ01127.1 hypothetical protein EZ242_06970 [Ramlibacter rhizophilus]
MTSKHIPLLASLLLGAGIAAAQTTSGSTSSDTTTSGTPSASTQAPGAGPGAPLSAAEQQAVEKLQQAANRLRESIQAMQSKPEGSERVGAIRQTQQALNETHEAMLALPENLRNAPGVSTTTYDESVRKLMQAADSLRDSIQSMAKLPAGDARNNAIKQANDALMQTHSAVAQAYVPTTSGTSAMGAGAATPASSTLKEPPAAAGSTGTPGESSRTGTLGSGATMPAQGAGTEGTAGEKK